MPKIVCISDTHTLHDQIKVPDGDILIHAGDFDSYGDLRETTHFNTWLGKQPHKHKIVIAGNHSLFFEKNNALARTLLNKATYLENSGCEIEGLKFWGSPASPEFCNWAFNYKRGDEIKRIWDLIPDDIDVLITHGGPYGFLDVVKHKHLGCEELLKAIERVKPKLHVFGHIHEGAGHAQYGNIQLVNASICDEFYRPINPPIVIDL